MHLEFSWDEAGDPRASGNAPDDLVARYLESDIGSSQRQAREVLAAIDHVAESAGSWADTGNAHTLRLTQDGATIDSSFDERAKPCKVALGELRKAVAAWLLFLERGRKGAGG